MVILLTIYHLHKYRATYNNSKRTHKFSSDDALGVDKSMDVRDHRPFPELILMTSYGRSVMDDTKFEG